MRPDDDRASLEETIAVLSDPALMAEIREADDAAAAGDVQPLADVPQWPRRGK